MEEQTRADPRIGTSWRPHPRGAGKGIVDRGNRGGSQNNLIGVFSAASPYPVIQGNFSFPERLRTAGMLEDKVEFVDDLNNSKAHGNSRARRKPRSR